MRKKESKILFIHIESSPLPRIKILEIVLSVLFELNDCESFVPRRARVGVEDPAEILFHELNYLFGCWANKNMESIQ